MYQYAVQRRASRFGWFTSRLAARQGTNQGALVQPAEALIDLHQRVNLGFDQSDELFHGLGEHVDLPGLTAVALPVVDEPLDLKRELADLITHVLGLGLGQQLGHPGNPRVRRRQGRRSRAQA